MIDDPTTPDSLVATYRLWPDEYLRHILVDFEATAVYNAKRAAAIRQVLEERRGKVDSRTQRLR